MGQVLELDLRLKRLTKEVREGHVFETLVVSNGVL
jgi:hypothetical protein